MRISLLVEARVAGAEDDDEADVVAAVAAALLASICKASPLEDETAEVVFIVPAPLFESTNTNWTPPPDKMFGTFLSLLLLLTVDVLEDEELFLEEEKDANGEQNLVKSKEPLLSLSHSDTHRYLLISAQRTGQWWDNNSKVYTLKNEL